MTILSSLISSPASHPILTSLLVVVLSILVVMPLFNKRFDPKGKYCYVTGGSTGLGYAVAKHLVQNGSDICIVSRDAKRIADAEASLKALAKPGQKIISVAADLTDAKESERALDEAIAAMDGRVPDVGFLCAGLSWPKYFVDCSADELRKGMDFTYWLAAYSALALTKKMVAHRIKGKLVLISSFLGYSTFVGYAPYSPGKYAIRGLADTLRNELLLHDISVHLCAPVGIDTPSYAQEQISKPAATKKIEESDEVQAADVVAGHLFRGLDKGYYQSTTHPLSEFVRVAGSGSVPGNNPILDTIYWLGSGVFIPIMRMVLDSSTKKFKKEVEDDLQARGFYAVPKGTRR